jgi:hypothetical protein
MDILFYHSCFVPFFALKTLFLHFIFKFGKYEYCRKINSRKASQDKSGQVTTIQPVYLGIGVEVTHLL